MKRTLVLCLIGFVLLSGAAWSQAQSSGGTEKAVAALEEQWLQSQKTNNPDLVAPLVADKFIGTGADGKVTNRAQLFAHSYRRAVIRQQILSVHSVGQKRLRMKRIGHVDAVPRVVVGEICHVVGLG